MAVKMSTTEQKRIAYHEAGHAVVAHVFKFPIKLVTLSTRPGSLGRCEIDVPFKLTSTSPHLHRDIPFRELAENYCMFVLAGYVAEELITGKPSDIKIYEDHQIVNDRIADWFPDSTEDWWVRQSIQACHNNFGSAELKLSLSKLDSSFIPLIEGYMKWLQARVRVLLLMPSHRKALEALSEMLMARTTIDGNEANAIISNAIA